ncbi:MAG TPA: glycosyltransferase family 2 protein [Mycobacteriales bacterium]|nr:glycosyltransferase family 2 protein [Mycobacteriales bacterium]
MTSPTEVPESPGPRVTAILLVHDTAQWLDETLAGITAQRHPVDRLIAVDFSGHDGAFAPLGAELDPDDVVPVRRHAGTGEAVRAALKLGDDSDWLWLLTDDSAPDPDALAELLERVERAPSIWQVGPKSHSWTGGRLLEAGATMDATGHRDVGIDAPELDQGQRDGSEDVLGVATAGSLIRRDVWDHLEGLDDLWSAFGDDVDLGWRVNAAGGRVVVAPRAVIRRGASPAAGPTAASSHPTPLWVRRQLGMQVVLANTSGWMLPVLAVRALVGGVLRALGLLVISRNPSGAWAELRAVGHVVREPGRVRQAAARRRATRELGRSDLQHLFPSTADKWRRSPLVAGLFRGERAEPTRPGGSYETGPVSEEAESLESGDSRIGAFLRRPASVLFVAMVILALIANRALLSGTLHGGRLLPGYGGSGDLWSAYFASWHPVSVGSVTTAPPSLAVLGALSTLALGKVWLAVDVILLGAVPLSALTAFLSLRALTPRTRVRVWASIGYALLPAVTGAVAGGRVDVALTAILLPLAMRAGAGAIGGAAAPRGWHRSFGAGLLLAVIAAMTPVLWPAAVVLLLIGSGLARRAGEGVVTTGRRVLAAILTLLVTPLVLAPWTAHVVRHPALLVTGSGLPERFGAVQPPGGAGLLLLHVGGAGQPPLWVGAPLIIVAVLSLRRIRRLPLARAGVLTLVVGIAGAIAATRAVGVTPGVADSRHYPGALLLLAGAGALLAAAVAATGAAPALTGHSFGWRQLSALGLVLLTLAATATLAGSWLVRGAGDPLSGSGTTSVPLFTSVEMSQPASPRAIVVQTDAHGGLSYALVRRPGGPQLGDADLAPASGSLAAARLTTAVRDLTAGLPGAGAELQPFAVQFVVVPTGSVSRLAPALAQTPTLTVVPAPGATVYRSTLPTGELSLVPPTAAAGALAGHPVGSPRELPFRATAGSADVVVPPGPPGRLAVLAEPVNVHWRATIGATVLSRRTAYGWAQAFELPSSGGRLRIGYHDTRRHTLLWGELAAVVVVALLALPTGRRPDSEVTA